MYGDPKLLAIIATLPRGSKGEESKFFFLYF
jgi:hypothetical protein